MPSSNHLLRVAEARMVDEFYSAGHISVEGPGPDMSHPLHELFMETKRLVEMYCPCPDTCGIYSDDLAVFRSRLYENLLSVKSLSAMKGVLEIPDSLEGELQPALPSNAEILALRFATAYRNENRGIIELLAKCNALHLWQVPRPANTEAGFAAVCGNDQASDTDGTPTEADSSIEAALKAGLTDAERKVAAIQDTKKDLKSKLAVVEEAEAAVLKAQEAMKQAQKALAKSDLALLQSPMSLLAMDI